MIVAPRWRKVLRDIAGNPGRTMLAVTAMTAGVFGLGTILTSYAILHRELAATYESTRPASAILTTDDASDATTAFVGGLPGILDAEARPVIHGRIRVNAEGSTDAAWVPLILFVIPDFDHQRLDTFVRETSNQALRNDDVLIERSALVVAHAGIGDDVRVKASGGSEHTLHVVGIAHAAGLAPAWMEHAVYGFVGRDSVVRADASAETTQIRVRVTGDRLSNAHILTVTEAVSRSLTAAGRSVYKVDVPPPGRHPHADQMDTFLFLLGAFGALTLVLGAVLVANMIHALLAEQVPEIGSMKAAGATSRQIAVMYLGHEATLATIGLLVGIPLGLAAGRGYARFAVTLLNATIASDAVPVWVFAAVIFVGIGVPLLVALRPVHRASRIEIHQAFSNDVSCRTYRTRRFDRWLASIAWLPRPLMLSLRATFHARGRPTLTVGTLAAGGIVVIAALSVSSAWTRAIDRDADARRYDIQITLARAYPIAAFAATITALPDVTRAEYWSEADATLGRTGHAPPSVAPPDTDPFHDPSAAGTHVSVIGPDPDTQFFVPTMVGGRWIGGDTPAGVVITPALLRLDPTLHVGGDITLIVKSAFQNVEPGRSNFDIDEAPAHPTSPPASRTVSWPIIGIANELFPAAVVYAPKAAVLAISDHADGTARTLRIQLTSHDIDAQQSAARRLDQALAALGIQIADIQTLLDRRHVFADHLVIIVSALLLAAGLVVIVGGLGLTTTLTINVMQRTREIGVLGAIGATPAALARQVVVEGVLIGVVSWLAAAILSVPVTLGLCVVTGRMFVGAEIAFYLSPVAIVAWLGFVVSLAAISSLYPARRAAQITVREALTYA